MKGFKDKNKKFHPINSKKGVRKSRIDRKPLNYNDPELIKHAGIPITESMIKTGRRYKKDLPMELSGFENIKMIENKKVRDDMVNTLMKLRRIFIKNDMDGGMIWGFLEDCVNGQILISLDKKPDHYVNRLIDFYIDSRVGFRGVTDVRKSMNDLAEDMKPIVKYDKPRFVVGDIVRPNPEAGNVAVRNALEKKPDVKFKIMEMERGLDPHYIGYQIVDVDKKPFKKNWIYAGNNNLSQGDLL